MDGTMALTGRISSGRIACLALPQPPEGAVEALKSLGGPTSAVADALDELGIAGVVGSATLPGSIPGACIVGPALTLRNVARQGTPTALVRGAENRMADLEAHNLARPGDVIVIQGLPGCSNMGGVAARIGHRQGEAGAIIDGGVRDIGESRGIGYPIWARELTPLTGKWRLEAVEVNGPVDICGVRVYPGDLVVADDCGVCFVPHAHIPAVVAAALKKDRAERAKVAEIDAGLSVPELAGAPR